ncbi:MAG TPA: hypothetical protein V6C72_01625 [Chroococcales cyanobacterium]
MRSTLRALSFIAVVTVASFGSPAVIHAQSDSAPAGAAVREPLKLHVEHQEMLPEVDSGLQPGNQFDPSAMKARAVKETWVQIPSWFAGQFASRSHTQVSQVSLLDGKQLLRKPLVMTSDRTDRHGMQQDARGGIWHRIQVPFSTEVPVGDSTSYQSVTDQDYSVPGADDVIIHYLGVQSSISPTGKVIDSKQVETIQEYRPLGSDQMQCTASLKEFDAAGHPITLIKEVWTERRIAGFTPYDRSTRGDDLRTSFRSFLAANNMTDLIPTD